MDPMANLIQSIQPVGGDASGNIIQPAAQPMFPDPIQQPQQQQYQQPQYQQPVYNPAQQPPAPQYQQPQYQQPTPQVPQQGSFQQPQYQQPGQQSDGNQQQQPNGYPLSVPVQIPQVPGADDSVPQWAQTMAQQMQQIQQQQQNPNQWQPKTVADIDARITERAQEIAAASVKQMQDQQQQEYNQRQQQVTVLDQQVNAVYGQLRQNGLLPIVSNPYDPNDPGKQAEVELLSYAVANGASDAASMARLAPTLKALHDNGMAYDHKQNMIVRRNGSQSAAASAPIAGGSPSMQGGTPSGPGLTQSRLATTDLGGLMQYGLSALPS
jgi:hypothetical protein